MHLQEQRINFAVGPVPISDSILELGKRQVPYFRTSEFSCLMKENEALMKKLVNAEASSRAVFLTGSGTAAMEAAVINTFSSNDNVLVVNGGSFGQRFCEICKVYGIPYTPILLESGQALTKEDLQPFENKNFTGLLVNMHETSTGVLYDMNLIGEFCRRKKIILIVDAVSAFLADELDMKAIGADIILTGSQKALALPPGVSILVLSGKICKKIMSEAPRCYYLSLKFALANGERGQTPFTPAVGVLIQLNARLNEICSKGLDIEREKIHNIATYFRKRIQSYPFKIASSSLSNAVTPLSPINASVSAYRLFEILKDEYGIIVCPNGGPLADSVFRVGHIGALTYKDVDELLDVFDDLIKRNILTNQ